MLKNKLKKRIFLIISSLLIILIIYLFPTKKIETINNEKKSYKDAYIYLIDYNNYVARVNVVLKENDRINKIKEIINYLTIDGNKSNYIKEGFKQVIPKDTKLLSVDIDNNIVKLNFSKELLNIEYDKIDTLISSLIYSITSLDSNYKLSIYIEGNILTKLPNNEVIDSILDRSYGINKTFNIDSINGITKTTIYYLSKYNDYYYYVPITLMSNNKDDKIKIIIEQMSSKSVYNTNLISYIKDIQKINYEIKNDYIVLNLNNNVFSSKDLIEETIYTLNLSIQDNYDVSKVIYYLDNTLIKEINIKNT